MRRKFWDLFVASFAALFFEMLLVRWLPTTIYYLGYYKNCILFATFLGFGCGSATRRKVDGVLPYFMVCVAGLVVGALLTEHYTQIVPLATGEFVWPQVKESASGFVVPLFIPLLVIFAVGALLMLPLGRLVGKYIEVFPPISGYSINIAASISGIATFLALSYLGVEPAVWFLIATLPILYFVRSNRLHIVCTLVGLLVSVGVLEFARAPREYWSPYSKITLTDAVPGVNSRLLSTNNNGHQVLFDLSPARLASPRAAFYKDVWDLAQTHVYMYESAYAIVHPRSVLIVGGGTGNEAAAALRRGVEKVDVVEIDPTISRIGRTFHPEQPYHDSRVRIINDDARHYMNTTAERYDLVIFGFLDSTSYLSSMSNIRLDNYVYTVESFRQARSLLNPNGLLQVTYYAFADFVKLKLFLMLEEVFGQPPLVTQLKDLQTPDVIFFAGPAVAGMSKVSVPGLLQGTYTRTTGAIPPPLARDDWPYLNMREKAIGSNYLAGLAGMVLISLLFVQTFVWSDVTPIAKNVSALCFFLQGAGFMLIETNTITRMALILGSTWVVTSVAVILVLLAALVANFVIQRSRFPSLHAAIAFVAVTTLLNYFVGTHSYLTALEVYLPILASSFVFGRLFQQSDKSSYDLGMNILGAMFGGMLEYGSLIVGTRTVYLLALVIFSSISIIKPRSDAFMARMAP